MANEGWAGAYQSNNAKTIFEITTLTIKDSSHGTPCAMKVACTVWLGAKDVKASDLSRLLLNSQYTAEYLQQLWKKVRKQGGLCTGITQNVSNLLSSEIATTMLSNSEFVVVMKQSNMDSAKMAEALKVSEEQLRYVKNAPAGTGLIKCGSVVIPFDNQIGKDTELYKIYSTNIHEKIAEQKKAAIAENP